MDHLQAGRYVVMDGRKGNAQRGLEPDFLFDLTDGALRYGLPGIDLSLGPRPVVVPGTVDQQDFQLVLAGAPRQGACRGNGNRLPGMVGLVRNKRIVRRVIVGAALGSTFEGQGLTALRSGAGGNGTRAARTGRPPAACRRRRCGAASIRHGCPSASWTFPGPCSGGACPARRTCHRRW